VPANLARRIANALDRARRYGLRSDADCEWFVELDLRIGENWEVAPGMDWALEILDNPEVDALSRRYRLEKRMKKWWPDE
jgi:hypothetical protein